jgi:hypothetical protein
MNETLIQFIHEKQIDSFQKVSFLLFLYRYAEHHAVSHEFARQLNFSGDPVLEEVVDELTSTGLLQQQSGHYILQTEPAIRQGLEHLIHAYDDPVLRQTLLGQIYQRRTLSA